MADNVVEIVVRARDEASDKIKHLRGGLQEFAAAATLAAGAFTAASAAIVVFARDLARQADDMKRLAGATGLTVESVSRLGFAAGQSETDIQALAIGVRFLQRNQAEAARGSKEAAEAFRRVGISLATLKGTGTEELLLKVADAMAATEDASQRTALAVAIFGRSGTALLPFLLQGRQGIEALTAEADRLGITMSSVSANLGDDFGDAVERVQAQIAALKRSIAEGAIPSLLALADAATKTLKPINDLVRGNQTLVQAIFNTGLQLGTVLAIIGGAAGTVAILQKALVLLGVGAAITAPQILLLAGAIGALVLAINNLLAQKEKKFQIDLKIIAEPGGAERELQRFRGQIDATKAKIQGLQKELQFLISLGAQEGAGRAPSVFRERTAVGGTGRVASDEEQRQARISKLRQEIRVAQGELEKFEGVAKRLTPPIIPGLDDLRDSLKNIQDESKSATKGILSFAEAVRLTGVFLIPEELEKRLLNIKKIAGDVTRILGETRELPVPPLRLGTERGLGFDELTRIGVSPPTAEWLQFFDVMRQTAEAIATIGTRFDTLRIQATGSLGEIQKLGLSVAEGLAIAFETFKDAGARAFDVTRNIADTTFRALDQFVVDFGDAFFGLFDDVFLKGKNVLESLGQFAQNLGKAIQQLLSDLIRGIITGIGQAIGFILVAAVLSRGGQIRGLAGGGQIAHGAGGLSVVPGMPSRRDTVLAALSPGEVVLPTIAGSSPAGIVERLASTDTMLKRLVTALEKGGSGGGNTYVTLSAFNLDALREMVRSGDLRREQLWASELGRA